MHALLGSTLLAIALAGSPGPTRVKDDNGCDKGLDAHNELDGEIVCTYPSGVKKYEGQYAHGKRVGAAKSYRDTGKLASLEHFVDGEREGLAEEYTLDGTLESACEYKHGKKDGPCKEFDRQGKLRQERRYLAGEQRGAYKEYYPTGAVREQGTLDENGKRDGLLERFRENGKPESSERFVHGQQDGAAREWHPNGNLRRELEWKNGEQHGLMKDYFENGQLQNTLCQQHGHQVQGLNACAGKTGAEQVTSFFPTGKPRETTSLKDGVREGESKRFSKEGTLLESSPYVADKLEGVQQLFTEQGVLKAKVSWKAGRREGLETVFFEDGKRAEENQWKNGAKVAFTTWWMNGKKKRAEEPEGELTVRRDWYDSEQLQNEERFAGSGYGARNEGRQRQWSQKGFLTAELQWREGRPEGLQRYFDEKTGEPRREEQYLKGVLTSRKEWDEKGAVVTDEQYNPDGSRR